ncbi:MAG: hypothetical protein KAF41_07660, partial [Flavobacterium sp.]|nr:hypothetical protein [Flavobacterium sp.]
IPIKSSSLAFYFNKALILPAIFYNNKPSDIQERLANYILLSKSKWVKNCDCSIEVVFTSEELTALQNLDDNFIQYDKPIPISRIKKVFFTDKKQKETTIWNINNGAGFVPEQILYTESVKEENFYSDFFNFEIKKSNINEELEKKINRFDTVLGGFAFMKIGATEFSEYPFNYFSTLSHFNKLINEQVESAKKNKGLNFSEKYKGLFISNDNNWAKWQPYIYRNVEVEEIATIASEENISIEKKLGIINLDTINPSSFIFDLSILAIYGHNKNKSTDDLVSSIQTGIIPAEKREEIALLFGLNTGYTKLRNQYKSGNKSFNVKFKFDSQLDYYIIESIYQFIFNNNKDSYHFNYIDSFCIKQNPTAPSQGFSSYIILDKLIIAKKKASLSEEYWNLYSDSICKVLSDYAKKYTPPFANFHEEQSNKYFKELLYKSITTSISEFEQNFINTKTEDFQNEILNIKKSYETTIQNLNNEIKFLKSKNTSSRVKEKVENKEIIQNENNLYYLNTIDYSKFTFAELKAIAKFLSIQGISKYKKENIEELISLIKNNKTIL